MKIKFLIAALFFSLVAAAQPSNYIKFNTRGRWIAGMFDSTFHVPRFDGSPSLRTGGSSMDGAVAIDTTNNIMYFYSGGAWKRANLDTSAYAVTSVYRKTASDSVFYVKGGVHTFAFKDSTGSGSSYTFTNGLTESGGTVKLGGTLTEYTEIDGADTYAVSFSNSNGFQVNGGGDLSASMGNVTIQASGLSTSGHELSTTYSARSSVIDLGFDTIFINPGFGRLIIDTLTSAVGTKALRYNPTTGLVTYADTTTGGSSAPSGNFGNIPVLRNGALEIPSSDSLDFDAGLNIKGSLSATAIPTGGVDADSLVVVTSAGAFKKRNKATFQPALTANQVGYGSASNLLNGSSKLLFYDGLYPVLAVVGSDPTLYLGDVSANYPALASSSGASIYGGDIYKSINFYDKAGGNFMARFYTSTGTIYNMLYGLVMSTTLSSPSNTQGSFAIQRTVPYAATGLNYHGFTDETDFRVGTQAFNSFGSFVKIGNNRTTQDHYASFQSVWAKDSTNTVNDIYDFVSAVSTMAAGTIDSLFRFKVFEMTKTGGTVNVQYGIYLPELTAAGKNIGLGIYTDSNYIAGNLTIGGDAFAASATAALSLVNGTIPSGSITNGVVLYAEDVASSSELKVRDEAGNITTLSPHNFSLIPQGKSEDMAWAFYSEKDGKKVNVDMMKLARLVEKLTGEKLVYIQ